MNLNIHSTKSPALARAASAMLIGGLAFLGSFTLLVACKVEYSATLQSMIVIGSTATGALIGGLILAIGKCCLAVVTRMSFYAIEDGERVHDRNR